MVTKSDDWIARLPLALSDIVNEEVRKFVEDRSDDNFNAWYRWHGEDLWMIYQDQGALIGPKKTPAIRQVRVTVGAFASETEFTPELLFMPDNLILTSQGRYVPPPQTRRKSHLSMSLGQYDLKDAGPLRGSIRKLLYEAWAIAESLPVDAANVLLP